MLPPRSAMRLCASGAGHVLEAATVDCPDFPPVRVYQSGSVLVVQPTIIVKVNFDRSFGEHSDVFERPPPAARTADLVQPAEFRPDGRIAVVGEEGKVS